MGQNPPKAASPPPRKTVTLVCVSCGAQARGERESLLETGWTDRAETVLCPTCEDDNT